MNDPAQTIRQHMMQGGNPMMPAGPMRPPLVEVPGQGMLHQMAPAPRPPVQAPARSVLTPDSPTQPGGWTDDVQMPMFDQGMDTAEQRIRRLMQVMPQQMPARFQ